MKILITAAATAHAYRLEKLAGQVTALYLADSEELPQLMLKGKKFIQIPPGDSFSFAHELLKICLDLGIQRVFVLRRSEVRALSKASVLFEEYGIELMVPPVTLLENLQMRSRPGELLIIEGAERGVYLIDKEVQPHTTSIFIVD